MLGGPRGPQMMYIHVTGFMLKCEATDVKLQENVLCRTKDARRNIPLCDSGVSLG